MRLIDRYLLRQLLRPIVVASAALTALALMSEALTALDLILTQHQSALVFAAFTVLAMPEVMNIVMPTAIFVGALVALNRLHVEQEIVICFASGMSPWRVISPALRLAGALALLLLINNLFLQPLAGHAMREAITAIRADVATTLIRPGEFSQPAPGLTLYAQSREPDGGFDNLFIYQQNARRGDVVYTAARGRAARRLGRPVLLLYAASQQAFSANGVLSYLTVDEYDYDLSPLVPADGPIDYKPAERYPHELFFPDMTRPWERKNRLSLLAEGHARLASPLYALAFMTLALAAIIGSDFSRLGYRRGIVVCAVTAAAARILGFVIQAACAHQVGLNALQYAPPLLAIAGALGAIFRPGRPARAPPGPTSRRSSRQLALSASGASTAAAGTHVEGRSVGR